MHACFILHPPALCCTAFLVTNVLGADDAWVGVADSMDWVQRTYMHFVCMGAISPRYAARLVRAGALTALERLVLKQRELCLGRGAAADASSLLETSNTCYGLYTKFVPRVRRPGPCAIWDCCSACVRPLTPRFCIHALKNRQHYVQVCRALWLLYTWPIPQTHANNRLVCLLCLLLTL